MYVKKALITKINNMTKNSFSGELKYKFQSAVKKI